MYCMVCHEDKETRPVHGCYGPNICKECLMKSREELKKEIDNYQFRIDNLNVQLQHLNNAYADW